MSSVWKDSDFQKHLFFVNALFPALLLAWDWWNQNLGANPIEALIRTTGVMALLFVVFSLCVTPLSKIMKWVWLIKQRRLLGLYAFFYGFIHLVLYFAFDRSADVLSVPEDIAKRPFIAVGMFTFILMIPLAVTSTNGMIKRMGGKRWKLLHRLNYIIVLGGVLHYWMIVKSDIRYPVLFGLVALVLLSFRIRRSNIKT